MRPTSEGQKSANKSRAGWRQFSRRHPRLSSTGEDDVVTPETSSGRRWRALFFISLMLIGLIGVVWLYKPGLRPLTLSNELVVGIRETPTSYTQETIRDKEGNPAILISGFDHDLVQTFAASIGKTVRFVIAENEVALDRLLERGEVHMAAAWLNRRFVEAPSRFSSAKSDELVFSKRFRTSRPYDLGELVVVHSSNTLPLKSEADLHAKKIYALPANSHQVWVQRLNNHYIWPELILEKQLGEFELLAAVSDGRFEYVVVPKSVFRIALNHIQGIDSSLTIGKEEPVFWVFPSRGNDVLLQEANQFLSQAERDGLLRQLRDRYFGAVDRLQESDRSGFLARIKSRLPQYLAQFKRAQTASGYDWRLLAALAYQESKWDGSAVSKTGVRGLMMLTGDTADRLGVKNRLDPYESIMGGARYLDMLRDDLPLSIPEPDRTWMAIASYNVGPQQVISARSLARSMGLNPDSWADLKKALPQLGETKSGVKIRGGEAVVTAENVRMYYAILTRLYPANTNFSLSTPTQTYGISAPNTSSRKQSGLR